MPGSGGASLIPVPSHHSYHGLGGYGLVSQYTGRLRLLYGFPARARDNKSLPDRLSYPVIHDDTTRFECRFEFHPRKEQLIYYAPPAGMCGMEDQAVTEGISYPTFPAME